jgi:hypothetical protein
VPFGGVETPWRLETARAIEVSLEVASLSLARPSSTTLARASYVKTGSAVAGLALGLGYEIRIILNIRRFGPAAASHFNSHPAHMSFAQLKQDYREFLTTGLFLLNRHGGCAIDYDELTDGENDEWAKAQSQVTGLEMDRLLAARSERLSSRRRFPRSVVEDREMDELYGQTRRYALLVADRRNTQNVSCPVAQIETIAPEASQISPRVYRPWGWYESLIAAGRFQVNRLRVSPGQALSLQMHPSPQRALGRRGGHRKGDDRRQG